MAKRLNSQSALLYLLAFVCGSYFTWIITVNRDPSCGSQQGLRGGFSRETFLGGFGRMVPAHDRETTIGQRASEDVDSHPRGVTRHKIDIGRTPHKTAGRNSSEPVRVLCWVMTSPQTLQTRARNVRETWGPRCDVTLYMSSRRDADFPAVGLDVGEGRDSLWNKTRAATLYIYRHHFHRADWFMKTDDDTYLIVDNLRRFLRGKNSSEPVYYGHQFGGYTPQGYMSGGAGYVLSKEAVRRLADALQAKTYCGSRQWLTKAEDVAMGECMATLGVAAGDSRDSLNRSRFLPLAVHSFFDNQLPEWYHQNAKYAVEKGRGCCSDSLISIHYVQDRLKMLMLDYYIHDLQLNT